MSELKALGVFGIGEDSLLRVRRLWRGQMFHVNQLSSSLEYYYPHTCVFHKIMLDSEHSWGTYHIMRHGCDLVFSPWSPQSCLLVNCVPSSK